MWKNTTGKLIIKFNHFVGNRSMKLDSSIYKNESGQSFTITSFKYYISNIHLKTIEGKEFVSNQSYLIDEENDQSKQITLNDVPNGKYISINYIIGIDSLHNCSGAQSGALDVVNGMFWSWNNGYIFLKLDGKSPVSHSPGSNFEFHIGGYKPPCNAIRTVRLYFNPLLIDNNASSSLKIKVDVSEIMKTPTTIDLSSISSVTDFHNAAILADNYKDMFSIMAEK